MQIEEIIGDIQDAGTIPDLKRIIQRLVDDCGFVSYSFIDTGQPHLDVPFYFSTTSDAWQREYLGNKFQEVDPCLLRARRTNVPFTWGSVPLPRHGGGRKPGAIKTMEAARDYGFTEGFVVPFHYVDGKTRVYSSLVSFFWKDEVQRFAFLMSRRKYELHLIMIHWIQRVIDLVMTDVRHRTPIFARVGSQDVRMLTDRERNVLSWAARGKTIYETAEILSISDQTVESYIRSAVTKLDAANKTHAVAKGIYLGLIDL